jgi:molybdopterin-containing oxidoreductase family membrane subunit
MHKIEYFKASGLPYQEIVERCLDPMRSKLGLRSMFMYALCTAVLINGLVCWYYQIRLGMGQAGYAMPLFWGIYIVSFVFWIGVAHAGALISAILRIGGAEWKSTVTRLAEVLTLFTLPAAGAFPLIHVGRIGVVFYMLPVPNLRYLWPNFRSPLVWDFFAISTYLTGSVLFLYVTMVPDIAIARPHFVGWRRKLYTILSWDYRGTTEEWRRMKEAAALFSVVILPVVISVHTIVSWDFAMQLVPGWHASVFGPFFFVGALFSGMAAVVTIMAMFKWTIPAFEPFLTKQHFDFIGRIWLVLGLAWGYLYFNEFLPDYYANEPDKDAYMQWLGFGRFAWPFWGMLACNVLFPFMCLSFKEFRESVLPMFILSIINQAGMYLERVNIVIAGLEIWNPLAYNTAVYMPTYTEVSIFMMTMAGVFMGYMLFIRVFPILPIWELLETQSRQVIREIAGEKVYFFKSGE